MQEIGTVSNLSAGDPAALARSASSWVSSKSLATSSALDGFASVAAGMPRSPGRRRRPGRRLYALRSLGLLAVCSGRVRSGRRLERRFPARPASRRFLWSFAYGPARQLEGFSTYVARHLSRRWGMHRPRSRPPITAGRTAVGTPAAIAGRWPSPSGRSQGCGQVRERNRRSHVADLLLSPRPESPFPDQSPPRSMCQTPSGTAPLRHEELPQPLVHMFLRVGSAAEAT